MKNSINLHRTFGSGACARVRFAGRVWAVLAAALLAMLLTLAAGKAHAHASLIDTQPESTATLASAPAEAVLRFNETVAPLVFKLVAPDGTVTPLAQTRVITNGIAVALPASSPRGTYLLSWRVVSADGHPVGGSLTYSIGPAMGDRASAGRADSDASLPSASSSPAALPAAIWLSRFGLYVTLIGGVGAVLFRAFFNRALRMRRSGLPGLAAVLLVVALGAQGLDALAAPWTGLFVWHTWRVSLATAYGTTAWLLLAAIATAYAGHRAGSRARITDRPWVEQSCAVLALALLGAALAASGHAASAPPAWLSRPVVFIHVVCVVLWAGSLLPLLRTLAARAEPSARQYATRRTPLQQFSRVIPWVLVLLVASGITLAILQLGHVDALWLTAYGQVLSIKFILFIALIGVAAFNRCVLTARVNRGDALARKSMARAIAAEIVLVGLILAAVASWRFTPPPRALASAPPLPAHLHIHTARAMADLELTRQADGRFKAAVFVMAGDESPLPAKEIALQLSRPAMGIEMLGEQLQPGPYSTWSSPPFALPVAGTWHVRVDVLVTDFDSVSLEGDIHVLP